MAAPDTPQRFDLHLREVDTDQLVAMVDGLISRGSFSVARQLCELALRKGPKAQDRARIEVRLGLAMRPLLQSPALLNLLTEVEKLGALGFVGEGIATWSKVPPFLEDRRFADIARKHAHLLPLPNWHWNLHTVLWAVEQTRDLPGDLVELGVFRGHTTAFVAEYVGFQDWAKRWHLVDTFDGIPEDQLDEGWAEKNEQAYRGTFSAAEVRERFAAYPNVVVYQGRVPEALSTLDVEAVSFAHVDMNNAAAEVAALDYLWPRLSPGGVIVLDDFGWAAAYAQRTAERAWMRDNGAQILALPTGQGVLIKR